MIYNKNIFDHKNKYTIGVEEEYMLCEPSSGNLINKADLMKCKGITKSMLENLEIKRN